MLLFMSYFNSSLCNLCFLRPVNAHSIGRLHCSLLLGEIGGDMCLYTNLWQCGESKTGTFVVESLTLIQAALRLSSTFIIVNLHSNVKYQRLLQNNYDYRLLCLFRIPTLAQH